MNKDKDKTRSPAGKKYFCSHISCIMWTILVLGGLQCVMNSGTANPIFLEDWCLAGLALKVKRGIFFL